MTLTLEQRVDRLEAIEKIRRLKAEYCRRCDQNYDPDGLAALFTEDAVWDAGPERGVHRGRPAIREFFSGISRTIPFAAHLVSNPVIDVDGETASGAWRMIMPCEMNDGAARFAALQTADYTEQYRRLGDDWYISYLNVRLQRLAMRDIHWLDVATGRPAMS